MGVIESEFSLMSYNSLFYMLLAGLFAVVKEHDGRPSEPFGQSLRDSYGTRHFTLI